MFILRRRLWRIPGLWLVLDENLKEFSIYPAQQHQQKTTWIRCKNVYLLSRQKLPEECRDWIGEDWRCLALDSPLRSFVLHCCLLSILRRYSRAHWKARWKEFDESANFSLTLMNDFECYNENEKSSFPAQFWYRFYMVFFCCCYCWFFEEARARCGTTTNEWGCSHVRKEEIVWHSTHVEFSFAPQIELSLLTSMEWSVFLPCSSSADICLLAIFRYSTRHPEIFEYFLRKLHAHSLCGVFTVYLTEI